MSDETTTPQKTARNIVAGMRSRSRMPAEEPQPEPAKLSPIKRLIGGVMSRSRKGQSERPDPEALIEKNRKLAERLEALEDRSWEIRESEELHRSLAEAFGDIIVDRTDSGELRFTNPLAQRYFGDSHPFPDVELSTVEKATSPATRDLEIETLVGPRWFSWTDIEMRDGITGDRHIRSVGRDITERKRDEVKLAAALKQAEEASDIKSRFLAMVSHEMRTPLNGIAGMARLLADTSLDATQRDHVDAIDRSGKTLLALVNDLLNSAQIEAGEMRLRPQSTSMRELVEESAEMLAPRAAAKSLALSTFVDPCLPDTLLLDGARLRQVLLNLGGNAVKFTQRGSIGIEVTGSASGSTAKIKIAVTDSGPGLAEDDQKRIFAEFAQAASGSDRQHDGAGLGLFISQRIAKLMGSAIEVASSQGSGSRFQMSFSAKIAQDGEATSADQKNMCVALVMAPGPARSALLRSLRSAAKTAHAFDSFSTLRAAIDRGDLTLDAVLADKLSAPGAGDWPLNTTGIDQTRLIVIDHAGAATAGESVEFDGWLTWPVRAGSLRRVLVCDQTPPRANESSGQAAQKIQQPPNFRVLLVEDNEINTLVAQRFLERLGCIVTHAPDGPHAISAFQEAIDTGFPFDHVLLDLNMPDMDGLLVLSTLREIEGAKTRSVITILSADDRAETRTAVLEKGSDGFLAKPLDFDAFSALFAASKAA